MSRMPVPMTRFPFDILAFDLDGTLADTSLDIALSLNEALAAIGRPAIDPAAVRGMIGDGARNLIRRALAHGGGADERLIDTVYPRYVAIYADHPCRGTSPYPGVEDAMTALAHAGVRLAICTNKPERVSLAVLDALGWRHRFASIVCGDTLPVRKPDPAPLREAIARAGGGRTMFVGDSIIDAETARAADLPFVAVSFGFRDRPVDALGADATIDSFDELMPALLDLSGPAGAPWSTGAVPASAAACAASASERRSQGG